MLNLLILNIQVIYKAKNITQHHDLISHANQYVPSVISFFHAKPLNIKYTSTYNIKNIHIQYCLFSPFWPVLLMLEAYSHPFSFALLIPAYELVFPFSLFPALVV